LAANIRLPRAKYAHHADRIVNATWILTRRKLASVLHDFALAFDLSDSCYLLSISPKYRQQSHVLASPHSPLAF
jgi:hypothetical protein